MKITSFQNYLSLSHTQRLLLIQSLRTIRIKLLAENKRKKVKKTRKKQEKPIKFESPALEAIFNNMNDDCKKLMAKALRYKEKRRIKDVTSLYMQ